MSSNAIDLRATPLSPAVRTHPGLTIAVYRVNPEGERTTVQPKHDVPAGNVPDNSLWPLCDCLRCRAGVAVR